MDNSSKKQIEDLLLSSGFTHSDSVPTKHTKSYDFSEEVILVTGAAGSIGSGLTAHILQCRFKSLILIDNAETALFYLKSRVKLPENTSSEIRFLLKDVRDHESMALLFDTYKPTLIFHAAAYKHVALLEENAYEALRLNILATASLANLCLKNEVKRFVFISTDKAVNPINTMGLTKHIAELYLDTLNTKPNTTKFISARFGNIFGSNGSVVPLFLEHIKNNEAIIVKNRNTTRYFIDKARACDLLLQLGLKHNNIVFGTVTFNMGDPIKIIDLAKVLLKLHHKAINDSTLKITKLDVMEKEHELIVAPNEECIKSDMEDIYVVKRRTAKTLSLSTIENVDSSYTNTEIQRLLKAIIGLS